MSGTEERPAKRARLGEPAATPAKAPPTTTPTSVDADLEREVRAGITEYVSPRNLGFTGVLKQRYTDFLVNEIGLDGRVVRLRCVGLGEQAGAKHEGRRAEAMKVERMDVVGEEASVSAGEKASVDAGEKAKVPEKEVANGAQNGAAAENANGNGAEAVTLEKEEEVPQTQPSEEDLASLHAIFGETTTAQILTLVRAVRRQEMKKAKDFKAVIAPPITDKDTRTQAHKSLRRIFPNLLESSMEADQSIRIKAVPPRERKGKNKGKGAEGGRGRDAGPDRRRGQLGWEELGGEFLHFTLYKENKDTMEVIGFLGSKLGSGSKAFSFPGTKDRRACTVQRVCVKRQTAERMNGFNKMLYNAAIGDFSYQNRDLDLGDLNGNEFTITLRDCHFQNEEGMDLVQRTMFAKDIVSKAIADFSEKGFINYYGLQRFGTFAASTDAVGLKLLKGDLKGAVDDLLAYSEVALAAASGHSKDPAIQVSQDDKDRATALHSWKTTGKGGFALELLPRKFSAERNIVQHLSSRNSKSGKHDRTKDWQGALMCIPRTLRKMYVHAYQSLVWNAVASKRWATYGDKVVEGDLVLVNEHKDKEGSTHNAPKQTIDQDGEIIINPAGADSALAADDIFERARPLTAAQASSGNYTVFDVVLPQPGFDVEYPNNAIGTFYEDFMGSERGGGLDPHDMRRSWSEISLSGDYRKFLAKPLHSLDFDVREYVRPEEQFVETDLQKVRKQDPATRDEQNGSKDVDMLDQGEKKLAVVLKFQLGTSQYATVALRELMKAGGVQAFKPEYMGGR